MEKLIKYTNEETENVNLLESYIIKIDIASDESTITFDIDWTECDVMKIVCEGCEELKMSLHRRDCYGENYINQMEIYGFSYLKQGNNYVLSFEFNCVSEGYISVLCKKFSFYVPSIPMEFGGNNYRLFDD